MKTSEQILQEAFANHHPSTVIALSSWGHDSLVSTEVAYQWMAANQVWADFVVVTLDTGVSADGYAEWVTQHARRYPKFELWRNDEVAFQWYVDNALGYGFGYTKSFHTEHYFRMLKERTLRKVLQAHKTYDADRVMFISGVYRAESNDRRDADEIHRMGAGVWVNPLCHWSKQQIADYRFDHNLPTNPFYETVGGSGDCQCNWGPFITLNQLNEHSPQLALKLAIVSREVQRLHGWGWGERPTDGLIAENRGQLVLPGVEPLTTPNLCAGCERPKPGQSEAAAWRALQEWTA